MRILGVDPGSRCTGFGVVELETNGSRRIAAGVIRCEEHELGQRLHSIFAGLCELIVSHQPQVLAVEQVFMHRNAGAALKLGQARGVAICAGASMQLPVHEYSPRAVKQAVVGAGGAEKRQVQHMVRVLLGIDEPLAEDAADALAVALCHGHTCSTLARMPAVRSGRGGRWR